MLLFKHIFIIFLVIYTIIFLKMKIKKNKSNLIRLIYYTFGVYIILIIGVTIFPIPIQPEEIAFNTMHDLGVRNNFIPIKTTFDNLISDIQHDMGIAPFKQILGNIIMFIPIGFYIPIINNKKKFKEVVLAGFIFSVGIELTQFIINTIIGYNYRSTDVDDIILNTLGAIIGYILLKLAYPIIKGVIEEKVS